MTLGFLLDTNVLSEVMREKPAPEVMAWLDEQPENLLYTSAVTQAEVLAGIAFLPTGKRRDALASSADQLFGHDFSGRCLVFGGAAAEQCALVRAQRKLAGMPISTEDAQIAAIALANQLTLVTRNTKDFRGITGIQVTNPWQPE
jgi:predicted nucleic acid-binding protein